MSINLVTYANQTVTPTNDAIIYERAIDQNGIFHGCNVTVSGNNVNITGGYGIICGREFVIESESIPVTLAPSGTNDGRLYVRLDLADADAPIQLLTDQGNPLPSLEQDADVNYVNGAYEMELATFTVGVSTLSDCVETFETIYGSKHGSAEFIQACMPSSQSIGTTTTVCNYSDIVRSSGNRLVLDTATHEIVVGKGIQTVEVTAWLYITAFGTANLKNIYIYLNNDEVATTVSYVNNNYVSLISPTQILNVSEGDKITVRAKTGGGTMTLGSSSVGSANSFIVKAIK